MKDKSRYSTTLIVSPEVIRQEELLGSDCELYLQYHFGKGSPICSMTEEQRFSKLLPNSPTVSISRSYPN